MPLWWGRPFLPSRPGTSLHMAPNGQSFPLSRVHRERLDWPAPLVVVGVPLGAGRDLRKVRAMSLPSDPSQVTGERLGIFYPHRRPRGTKVDMGWDGTTEEQPMGKVPASGHPLLLTS